MNSKLFNPPPYVRRDTNEIKNTPTTTQRTYAVLNELSYPQVFEGLASDQQRDIIIQLKRLPFYLQQQVLDEWQARCDALDIRNTAGYLFGIIKKARNGEFRINQAIKEDEEK